MLPAYTQAKALQENGPRRNSEDLGGTRRSINVIERLTLELLAIMFFLLVTLVM